MRNREELRALQLGELNAGLTRLAESNRFYRAKFAQSGLSIGPIESWEQFRQIPFTSKAELLADQAAEPPYGSNLTAPLADFVRFHQTSGSSGSPLRWLDTAESWPWVLDCWTEIFAAAEITHKDRLLFPFSFGPFLGFWAAFDHASRSGNFLVAAGGLSSIARLQQIATHRITVVFCTPSYALRLAQVAESEGIDLAKSSVRALVLAGEPGGNIPATRARIESAWGARVFDHSGMTEIGSLGLEYAEFPGKLYLLEDRCIAEFIDPKTCEPVAETELGELVLTNLGRWASPLIRYRTGDLVRWRFSVHPAGKAFVHLEGGILGRVDDMFFIRGNNVYPSAIENILREFEDVGEFQLEPVDRQGALELIVRIETISGAETSSSNDLQKRVESAIHHRLHFRPIVESVPAGSLPATDMKSKRLLKKP